MTHKKVIELANKFANQHNKEWQDQRERLESFYYDTSKFFRTLINEMDGDLLTLKQKNIHPDVIKMFSDITHKLISLYLDIDPEHPYKGIDNLINWTESKETKVLLENLEFLIKEYLFRGKIDFEQTPHMKHPQVQSIKRLLAVIPKLRNFMNDHPMLPDPRNVSTVPPPIKINKELISLGPNDPTKIFPTDIKMPAE